MKTTGVGGEERGYDGAKKVEGRKRHLLVDTQGSVLEVRAHSAKVVDTEEASSSCWILHRPIASRAYRTCGLRRATQGKAKVRIGCTEGGGLDGRDRAPSAEIGPG